jgi:hypothetical protein
MRIQQGGKEVGEEVNEVIWKHSGMEGKHTVTKE